MGCIRLLYNLMNVHHFDWPPENFSLFCFFDYIDSVEKTPVKTQAFHQIPGFFTGNFVEHLQISLDLATVAHHGKGEREFNLVDLPGGG